MFLDIIQLSMSHVYNQISLQKIYLTDPIDACDLVSVLLDEVYRLAPIM
jgi:hypothetical protein